MPRDIGTVGVVGLGTMGAGIAEVAARAGLAVVGVEQSDDLLARGRKALERSTARAVERGRLEADQRDALLARIDFSSALSGLERADVVVEAIPERLDVKTDLFQQLDSVVSETAILATNTSSLSVTSIAAATRHPERVVGMHFFNPAPVLKLVEVVRTDRTAASVVADVEALARRLGKTPVVIGDAAGFIANKLLFGYLNHAMWLHDRESLPIADIDAAMNRAGFPMGAFALLDLIGLDTAQQILVTIHTETGSSRYAPPPALERLVAAGALGRKSGRGFFSYDAPAPEATASGGAVQAHGMDVGDVLLYPYLNDAVTMTASGYASVADIDTAMTLGCGFRAGPFEMLDDVGAAAAVRVLTELHGATGDPTFAPAPLLRRHALDQRTFRK